MPTDWRKAKFLRPFSLLENALFGDGNGSEWDFAYDGGSFKVQFKCDGYNHFRCPSYPAHSHWSLLPSGNLFIDWGQYGKYEMTMDPATGTMSGSVQGKPDQWRKATFLQQIVSDEVASYETGH